MTWADTGGAALALWTTLAAAWAAWKRESRALDSARIAALATFGGVIIADVAMVGALLQHDFSIRYVAFNNSRETLNVAEYHPAADMVRALCADARQRAQVA